MSSIDSIRNFVQLTPDLGTSGQPDAAQLGAISDAGYDAVINLALATSDNALAEEGSLVTSSGMRYVHIPVDFENPTIDDLRLYLSVLRALEGKRVWVHCAVNARVSAFTYHYLKHVRGLDDAAARSPVLDRWEMNDTWRSFMALTPEDIGPAASPLAD